MTCGHRSHRPSGVAIENISGERTVSASSSSPMAMVEHIKARTHSLPPSMQAMMTANVRPRSRKNHRYPRWFDHAGYWNSPHLSTFRFR
jgi:hypothetical protein